jgi:hypothetical protein
MYPKNAASPERISIGAVVQISDGAVQTAGVTVRILPAGGSEADGVGTVAYSTDGVVVYTPTQAETNYTSFVLIAKKTGCIPADKTVVTSASSTAGHAGTDQSKITNTTSTVNLSGTTIKTATDIETDTQDIQSRIPATLVDGRIAANAQVVGDKTGYTATVSDKTGFSLTPTTGLGNQTANITGNLSGSVGSVTGSVGSVVSGVTVSDKTGFSLLAGTGLGAQNGSVALVTKVDELGVNALTANGAVDAIPTAVWNALTTTTWVADSFGKHILISNNNNRSVQVTGGGSGHIAADIHALQAGVITSAAFSANWFTAAGLAADAATEIATAVAATQALSRLDSMIESDGAGQFRFDTIALEMAPAGGGGGGTDWTANERTAIRAILGVPTSGTTPTDPSSGILDEIRDQTALITAGGTVNVSTPVTASGQLASPLIIGDDYLAANGRRFRWTVALPSGYVIATSTARFGMRYEDDEGVNEFVATGTVTDATGGNVHLDFDVAKTVTGTLRPGWYQWSVEIVSATGTEITRVKSGKNVEWQEKQT